MPSTDLQKAFEELKPWITKFTINGIAYGGDFDALNDIRVNQFFRVFPDAHTILELGSLEGGHTFALSKSPGVKRVVGVEGRQSNIQKARCVQKLLDIHNVEFITGNLEELKLSLLGTFDAVFCVGVLYHLPTPWDLIKEISGLSKKLFIWTHYANETKADKTVGAYRGIIYKEFGLDDALSGMSPESFWPTLDSLKEMHTEYGFTKIQIIKNDTNHPNGPCVTLAAIAT